MYRKRSRYSKFDGSIELFVLLTALEMLEMRAVLAKYKIFLRTKSGIKESGPSKCA